MKQKILPLIITCLLLLTNCSTLTTSSLTEVDIAKRQSVWAQNKSNLTKLKKNNSWTLLARAGVVSKEGSSSNQIDWLNKQDGYLIKINNLVTFGEITISNQNNQTTLNYQNETYSADNPDNLLFKLTQLNLPVSQLEYWILGLPSPKYKINTINLNQYAVIENLKQNNFTISYSDYSQIDNYILPNKITIKTHGLFIKIQVQSWYV